VTYDIQYERARLFSVSYMLVWCLSRNLLAGSLYSMNMYTRAGDDGDELAMSERYIKKDT
jgi:hypothetical protein